MELRNLITFIHVAELGSFTKAANALFLNQPNLTRTIKNLEEELGTAPTTKPEQETPSADQSAQKLVLHSCDSTDKIGKATLNTDATYVKEGSASLIAPARGQEKLLINLDTPLDVSAYTEGYLHMWVYAEDASRLHWGQIELTSSGTCDHEEIGWLVTTYIKKDGWNELYLPLATASKTGGDFDATALNYLRLFIIWDDGGDSTTMYFDDIYFTNVK